MPSETTAAVPTPAELAGRSARVAGQLRQHLPVTPLLRSAALSEEFGAEVHIKCEHLQRTGSFKARGAMAKLLTLTAEERAHGVVTASTGNHGLGFANALATLGGRGTVFVPSATAPTKLAALRRSGVGLRLLDTDPGTVELLARAYADDNGLTWVSPYNDPDVIAGQGSVAVEILEQLGGARLDAIVVNVGGGGLISGVASVLKTHLPGVRVIGASPANDAGMIASVRAGHVVRVDAAPTLSDGSGGNVEKGSITFPLCRDLVDDWVAVDEPAIAAALASVIDTEHHLVEGSAAVAFAAARALRAELAGLRVAILSCGANIAPGTLADALALAGAGR